MTFDIVQNKYIIASFIDEITLCRYRIFEDKMILQSTDTRYTVIFHHSYEQASYFGTAPFISESKMLHQQFIIQVHSLSR